MPEAFSSASLDLGRHFHSFSPRNGIRFLQNGGRRSDLFERAARERYVQQSIRNARARAHTHTHNTQEQFERGMRNIVSATKGEIQRDSNKEQCKNREKYKIERKVNECDKTACTCGLRPHVLVA